MYCDVKKYIGFWLLFFNFAVVYIIVFCCKINKMVTARMAMTTTVSEHHVNVMGFNELLYFGDLLSCLVRIDI